MVMLKKSADEPQVISDIDTILLNTKISEKYTTHLVGEPVTDLYSSMLIGKNMQRLFPLTILVIFILLFLSFFSLRGVFIPVVGVIGSAVISMGVMAGLGIPFGHGTSIMPILIASIAVADSIHILRKYYLLASEGVITNSKELVKMTMDEMNIPVFLTTVTTMAGFLSLGVSQIRTVTHLSIFTALGVFIALLYSIFFIPATLSLIKMPKVKRLKKRETRISRPFTAVGNFSGKRPVTVMIIMLAVLLLASVGFWKLEIDSNPIENFNKEHPLRKADTLINGKFAGSYPLTFVLMGKPGSVVEPGVLKAIDDLETYARTLDDVGGSQSIVPFIKKLNMIIYGGDKSEFRVPGEQEKITGITVVDDEIVEAEYIVDGKDIIENYLTLLDMSGKPDDLANMLNNESSATQFTLFLKNGRKSNLEKVKLDLDDFIEKRFEGLPVEINATGMPVLSLVINNLVTRSQVESILIAVALVIILCSILFRSIYAGLFTTIPLAVSVFLNFCIMGLLGIQLEVMTMLIASIVIGVGVDYAIHYVYKMMSDVSKGLKPVEANINTMKSEGVAIFFNAIIVAFGFLVMVFSDVRPVRWMGVLISMTMITSAVGALFILPPLLIKLNPKFLFKLSQRGKK
jgi:predicted RND superfamily exporter protein